MVVVGGNVLHHVKGGGIVRAGKCPGEHVRGKICPGEHVRTPYRACGIRTASDFVLCFWRRFLYLRRRHNVLYLSVRSFVRPSIRYQTCEHDILKTNEPILMQICTRDLRGKGMEWSAFGSGRQKSTSQEAIVGFRWLKEASFSNPLGRVGFLF